MDQTQPAQFQVEDGGGIREMLGSIHEQGRLTLELIKTLVTLLMPKEGGEEGPSLEDLLAKILTQQIEIIALGKATQADVDQLGKTLPDEVAAAVGRRRALNS